RLGYKFDMSCFFFSSRRRHTRSKRDWSSDVCSSDLHEIIGFAELEDFADVPVRTYSSGMYMRLGFSVAMHVNPDVLLLDEVLAEIGRASCRERAIRRVGGR